MKSIFRYFFIVICLSSNLNLLHSQWVKTNFPSYAIGSLAVSGTNLFAGEGSSISLSTDNGTTWAIADIGLTEAALTALVVSGTNLFAVTNGPNDIYKSTNDGKSWMLVNSGLENICVTALTVSGSNLFAGTFGTSGWGPGGVYLSTNNGTSWTALDTNLTKGGDGGVRCLAVSPNGEGGMNLFAGTYLNGVLLSTNNGTSWTAINSGFQEENSVYAGVYALAVSGANLFAGTTAFGYTPGRVYHSSNSGTSWAIADSGLPTADTFDAFAIIPNGAGGANIFAGASGIYPEFNNAVFLSTNNGTNWRADGLTYRTSVFAFAVLPNGAGDTSLFAGTIDGIWQRPLSKIVPAITLNQYDIGFSSYSTHSLMDTLRITNSSSAPLVIDSVYTKTKWFTVSSLHDTVTKGDTISLLVSFLPDSAKVYSDTLYIVSNSIYSMTKVPLSGHILVVSVPQNNSIIPKSFSISQNYPNPFNPTTVINYQLPVSNFVTLKVYDILGREVEILLNEKQNAGTYTVTFNAGKLSSGVYFYRLQAGTFTETKKLILLR